MMKPDELEVLESPFLVISDEGRGLNMKRE